MNQNFIRRSLVPLVMAAVAAWSFTVTAQPAGEPPSSAATVVHEAEPDDGDMEAAEPAEASAEERAGDNRELKSLVMTGGSLELKSGEQAESVVVVAGKAKIDGNVEGDVVIVWGTGVINGRVSGNVIAPFTTLKLGPEAHIEGELVAVGGKLDKDPAARVDGEKIEVSLDELEQKWDELAAEVPGLGVLKSVAFGLGDWFVKGPLLGRFLPHQWGWWWWWVAAAAVFYGFCALAFPKPIAAGVTALKEQPMLSLAAGLLGYLGGCIFVVILLLTGVGVLVAPFVIFAAMAIQLLGKVVVCQGLGYQLGHQSGVAALERPLPGLGAGFALMVLMAMVPLLSFLVALFTAPLGFGAVLLAAVKSMRRPGEPGSRPLVATPVTPAVAVPIPASASVSLPPVDPAPLQAEEPPILGAGYAAAPVVPSETELLTATRAGFWVRLAATLLDIILVVVVGAVTGMMDYFLLLWFAYHLALWTWRGTTVGGIILGLKILRREGAPLTFVVALVRSLATVLSLLALGIGFFWAGWSKEKTAWHDLVAGTVMVRLPRGAPLV